LTSHLKEELGISFSFMYTDKSLSVRDRDTEIQRETEAEAGKIEYIFKTKRTYNLNEHLSSFQVNFHFLLHCLTKKFMYHIMNCFFHL
jgi:hypothetical protein